MRAWPWIACLGLLACPERSFQSIGSDASVVDDAGMDGGSPDSGPADGGECLPTGWRLETRPIVEVTPLFPTPSRLGATEQLDVAVQLNNSCERLSHLEDVGYSGNATDFVGLVAHVWVPGFCLGPAVVSVAHRVFRVPEWGNYRVVVSDRSESTGELLLSWDREQCSGSPDCTCWGGGPRGNGAEGTTCRTDCSCAAGLSCLCATGVATSEPCACARPCADFLDCAAGERCATLLGSSCAAGSSCANGRCPDGFVCRTTSAWINER